MFKGINIYSMLKNGTIAVLTLFIVGTLFGSKNMLLAFPIALTSSVLGRQNYNVKTLDKTFKIMFLDLVIVTMAYLSRLNTAIGIVINFTTIFVIIYAITSQYDLSFYKPFIMLYVFTQYAWVPMSNMGERYLSVIVGVIIIVICNKSINNINEKNVLGKNITKSISIIIENLKKIESGNYDEKKEIKCTNIMMELAYKIYISRHRDYLTTNLGKIQFKMFMNIGHLNFYLREIEKGYLAKDIDKEEIVIIINLLENIKKFSEEKCTIEAVVNEINKYVNKYIRKSKYSFEVSVILINLSNNIISLNSLNIKEINKIYERWQRSDFGRTKYILKEYFTKDSIRFKFAMRMAITVTIALFIGEFLGYYKIVWAIITIMSVLQPYYEDTIKNTRDRIIGNGLAIVFTGIIINIVNNRFLTISIMISALYLLYGYKSYDKISLFAAIASICIASLSDNINKLILYRVFYVIVGVIIVILANRFIFPYKVEDGIKHIKEKIKTYNNKLIKEGKDYLQGVGNINIIRDLIIHLILMNRKLYLRNLQYKNEDLEKFIKENCQFAVEVGYAILISYGKNEEFRKRKLEEINKVHK